MTVNYKETLLLPKTDYPMKPDLDAIEPEIQAKWHGLYETLREIRKDKPLVVVHDGPPYANGDIHFGHMFNKVLKDILVRYLTLSGCDAPFVPGWDCHGLPIEHRVMEYFGTQENLLTVRKACRVTAGQCQKSQAKQFQRLGLLADWSHPYLTMDESYKRKVLEILSRLVDKDQIKRELRPIAWCPHDETALAEAELEYKDVESDAFYVEFPAIGYLSGVSSPFSFVAWTTTPWTLPGNVALAVNPDLKYVCVKMLKCQRPTHRDVFVVEESAVANLLELMDVADHEILGECLGSELVGKSYLAPMPFRFLVDSRKVVGADFVTQGVGTGVVHIAPAHGLDDYKLAIELGLTILDKVDEAGKYNIRCCPEIHGQHVKKKETLKALSSMLGRCLWHQERITHSYPHCWRCHYPTITRATPQWFVDLDKNALRTKALKAISETTWIPENLQNRIEGMVESRPNWCISRQRHWGIKIPAFHCHNCNQSFLTKEVIRVAIEEGDDWWRDIETKNHCWCPNCEKDDISADADILDVWFESGSSFASVVPSGAEKVIYIEGSDQHRGWFQSSLLLGTALNNRAPFDTVITHGWVVDESGKKFSKSKGAPPVIETLGKFGADVIRLFIASQDYTDDLRVDDKLLTTAQDVYRKIRNTFRFILGNMDRAWKNTDSRPEITSQIDFHMLTRLNDLIGEVKKAYDSYRFYHVYHLVYNFCVVDLSSVYFDVVKDRLYADDLDSPSGNSVRWVLRTIYETLARLISPILPHTAEELWSYRSKGLGVDHKSIFLETFPQPIATDERRELPWDTIFKLRERIFAEIEKLRSEKVIRTNEEVWVILGTKQENILTAVENLEIIRDLCKVADVFWIPDPVVSDGFSVEVQKTKYAKCERCWRYRYEVEKNPERLCTRCSLVMAGRNGSRPKEIIGEQEQKQEARSA